MLQRLLGRRELAEVDQVARDVADRPAETLRADSWRKCAGVAVRVTTYGHVTVRDGR